MVGNQRHYAATWETAGGETTRTTYGGTVCWWPRIPSRLRIQREGFTHVIRCGKCPGCQELDRIRLEKQFAAKYQAGAPNRTRGERAAGPTDRRPSTTRGARLYAVRVYAPLGTQTRLAHALHRRRGLALEPGILRLGTRSFALLSREAKALPQVLARLGVRCVVMALRLSRGRRAFRPLTAGLLVSRKAYGPQVKRWYVRGLPPREGEAFEVVKLDHAQKYDRWRGPRAWTADGRMLRPPILSGLHVTDRRTLQHAVYKQTNPEGVLRIMGLVADTLRNAGRRLHVTAPPQAVLTAGQVARWYAQHAARTGRSTAFAGSDSEINAPGCGGGYISSEHSQGELMPLELARQRRAVDAEARKGRYLRESLAIIDRLAARWRQGQGESCPKPK